MEIQNVEPDKIRQDINKIQEEIKKICNVLKNNIIVGGISQLNNLVKPRNNSNLPRVDRLFCQPIECSLNIIHHMILSYTNFPRHANKFLQPINLNLHSKRNANMIYKIVQKKYMLKDGETPPNKCQCLQLMKSLKFDQSLARIETLLRRKIKSNQ